MIWAGSPGIRCRIKKTSSDTPNRTGTATASLRPSIRAMALHGCVVKQGQRVDREVEPLQRGGADEEAGGVVERDDDGGVHDDAVGLLVEVSPLGLVADRVGLVYEAVQAGIAVVLPVEPGSDLVTAEKGAQEV